MLLFGRIIWGLAVGIQSVCMPRYVEEFVPLRKYGLCIALYAFSMNIGTLIALMSGIILPLDDDTEALLDNQVSWRIIFGFPAVLFTISLVGFLVQIRFDGPPYYFAIGKFD